MSDMKTITARQQLEQRALHSPIIYNGLAYQRLTQCEYEEALIKIIITLDDVNKEKYEREIERLSTMKPVWNV